MKVCYKAGHALKALMMHNKALSSSACLLTSMFTLLDVL